MPEINALTAIIITIFALPLIRGASDHFSREKIRYSLWSLFDNIEFLLGILIAIYLTRRTFFDNGEGLFKQIYNSIPAGIRNSLYGQDVIIYIIAVPVILLLFRIILRYITQPLYSAFIDSLSNGFYKLFESMGSLLRRMLGVMSQLPRAVFIVFVLGLLLNFYAYYYPSPILSRLMNDSVVYQSLYKNAVCPVLNSNIAKKIPVLVNDSFARTMERVIPEPQPGKYSNSEHAGKIRIIKYFNGVTLDEAIKSNASIDETAQLVAGSEKNSYKKAYLIYKWVNRNIQYDYDKAAAINKDSRGISSGSIIAFESRKGICFDYSCLYISMCRAVGLKVRLIAGLGYSGVSWGDHAWNQVYALEEGRWINVDTTFGSNGNYFDKTDFNVDHRYGEIQEEWGN